MAARTTRISRQPQAAQSAFSLVEVVLAIGVVSFALIVIVGLLPIGLKSNHDSMEESQAVNLLQALVSDRQASPYSGSSTIYNLPALSSLTASTSGSLYVMDDAVTTTNVASAARYRVTYTAYPAVNSFPTATNYPSTGPLQPVSIDFKISWPAAQATTTSQPASIETVATFMK